MNTTSGTLHTIRWNELCPWLILVRATRVALMVRVLLLALIGVMLTQAGWSVLNEGPEGRQFRLEIANDQAIPDSLGEIELEGIGPLVAGWRWAIQPLTRLFVATTWTDAALFALAGVWVMAVWSLLGGAIARIAALYLTRGETLGPLAAIEASAMHFLSTIGAPAITFVGLVIMSLPLTLAGLIVRLEVGAAIVGLMMIVPLLMGLVFAIAAIGLLLGWPLMWSTIAVERTDSFDAVSRSYSYVYQRPLHLLFYVALASIFGLLAQWFLSTIMGLGGDVCHRLLWLGGGEADIEWIRTQPGTGSWTVDVREFWKRAYVGISNSFPMAFLFPTAVAIYLLLRREIDSAELDQVTLDDPAEVEAKQTS